MSRIPTALHLAVIEGGFYDVASALMHPNVAVNGCDGGGQTALWLAARGGKRDVVFLLLGAHGVDRDAPSDTGQTPLWIAAKMGHLAVIELLVGSGGVDINAKTFFFAEQAPLWIAAKMGHVEVVARLMCSFGIDLVARSGSGETALCIAVRHGHVEVVRRMMMLDSCVLLHGAVRAGNAEVVRFVLGLEGVCIDWNCMLDHATLLCEAARAGHVDIVGLLLGAKGIRVNDGARTALALAAKGGYVDVVVLLLAHPGVDANKGYENEVTPLHLATVSGHVSVVSVLLAHPGVDVNKACMDGTTPLWIAAREGLQDIVALLLARSEVMVNKSCGQGYTPLHCAVIRGQEGVVRLLLAHKNVSVNTLVGVSSPLIDAAGSGQVSVVSLLFGFPGVDVSGFVRRALSCDCAWLPMLVDLRTRHGVLDLRGLYVCEGNAASLFGFLAKNRTGVTVVDLRGNPLGRFAKVVERSVLSNKELLSIKCDVRGVQRMLLRNQREFLDRARLYVLWLKALFADRLPSEHLAEVGAMAYAEHFVPRGPRMYMRARSLLLNLCN
jgi:ankyrin repeat protein